MLVEQLTSKPPPKIQNKTGNLSPALVPFGRTTLMDRQSSLILRAFWNRGRLVTVFMTWARKSFESESAMNCGHAAAIPEASKVPRDDVSLTGGLSLRGPTGGWAKGMPLKASVAIRSAPMMEPEAMVTVGAALFSITFVGGSGGAAATRPSRAAATKVVIPFMVSRWTGGKRQHRRSRGSSWEGTVEILWLSLSAVDEEGAETPCLIASPTPHGDPRVSP